MKTEKTKIAVPITDTTQRDVLNKALLIENSIADMVEWRVDYYEEVLDLNKVLETLEKLKVIIPNKPILFTFRTKGQGGTIEISHEYYKELNIKATDSKNVDLIDIEMFYLDKIGNINLPIVGSYHNFKETPSKKEMLSILKNMESMKADILKIAVMPNTPKDVLTLLDASYEMYTTTGKPIISISMGEIGKISRISGELFGSYLTFASLGKESAPGQMSLEDLSIIMEKIYG